MEDKKGVVIINGEAYEVYKPVSGIIIELQKDIEALENIGIKVSRKPGYQKTE